MKDEALLTRTGHSGTCCASRRQFLVSAAALGASVILPSTAAYGETRAGAGGQGLIDVHHHILPPVYFAEARAQILAQVQNMLPPAVAGWTPQKSLEEMDRLGIATSMVSVSSPGVWLGQVEAGRSLARKCNEYAAEVGRSHPGRFGSFASIPLPDTEGSLREIEYALDVLKADGICLLTSYGDKWLGDPAFATVLDELNRRKAIVYVHPTAPNCCRDLMSYVPQALTEFPHDTTRTVTSLLYTGSFGRLRDIRFIFSHAGGTVPMLAGRIAQLGRRKDLAEKVPQGVEYELKRLYYEIANSANRSAMSALMNLVPTSQIMFGSDYPFVPLATTAEGLTRLGLSTAEVQAIGRDNAIRLLPRFAI